MRTVNKKPFVLVRTLPNPEDNAKLQALYSRSHEGVQVHLEKVEREGSSEFMNRVFIGYGHQSVGDLGTTTVFIEGVSNLVAKAIQDNPLYNGQESSTRYLPYDSQPIVDGYNNQTSTDIINNWLDIYNGTKEYVIEGLQLLYPIQEEESQDQWERAIKARAFDILRGFLACRRNNSTELVHKLTSSS